MIPILLKAGADFIFDKVADIKIDKNLDTIISNLSEQKQMLISVQDTLSEQSLILSGLQTSMSIMGVTSVASIGLSAFSLYKINQVSKDIKSLSYAIDSGFIDLKEFVSQEMQGLVNHQQQVKLAEAYLYYQKGLQSFQKSFSIQNREIRYQSILDAIKHLDKALVIYSSQKNFQNLSVAGELRHLEVIMIIESLKAEFYLMMGEKVAGKDYYNDLLNHTNKELKVIGSHACKHTIDLVLTDIILLKHNDLKLIEHKLAA